MNKDKYQSFSGELRNKWRELPSTRQGRNFSSEMLKWSDEKLLDYWEQCKLETDVLSVRGWFQELYKEKLSGCTVADVGPGVGIDGIYFAEHGAKVTFVDIVEDNLKLIERVCNLKNIKADFYYVDDFFNYKFKNKFDVFTFIGSMHNAPFEFSKKQVAGLTQFLNDNGKVLMLAYPKERFIESGARDFEEFGKMTDGERTPWCEWYDDSKIEDLFGENFRLMWSRNFGKDNIEFNWFDITKISDEEKLKVEKKFMQSDDDVSDKNNNPFNKCVIDILMNANKNINLLIFGAGNGGKLVYKEINKIDNEINFNIRVNAFLDNSEKTWGNKICKTEILKPEKELIDKADYVLIASDWKEEIEKQLVEMGVNKEKIIVAY